MIKVGRWCAKRGELVEGDLVTAIDTLMVGQVNSVSPNGRLVIVDITGYGLEAQLKGLVGHVTFTWRDRTNCYQPKFYRGRRFQLHKYVEAFRGKRRTGRVDNFRPPE